MVERDWRQYETQIYERLRTLAGKDSEVLFDQSLPGRLSETSRQVDVVVRGAFADRVASGTMAVDCKCWTRQVDVTDVDRFIGTIEDIGTDYGLLVTTEGFTPAAKRRAENARGIRVDVVPYESLADWEPPIAICAVCAEARDDAPPGFAYLAPFDDQKREFAMGAGQCDRCDAFHLECACGAISSIPDFVHGEWHECDGGCGLEWRVDVELDRQQVPMTSDPREQIGLRRVIPAA